MPRVSLGLPVYNGADTLPAALAAISAQTFTDYELIISDNASTDGTETIARAAAERDPRIVYSRNDRNIGMLENFAHVASLATGEYFAWVAADDVCERTYVEDLVEALTHHPEADFAYSNYDWIDRAGRRVRAGQAHFGVPSFTPGFIRRFFSFDYRYGRLHNFCLYYLWRNPFLVYGLYRRAAITAALPFEYLLDDAQHADNLFMLRILSRYKPILVDRVLFHYRLKERTGAATEAAYARGGLAGKRVSAREKLAAFEQRTSELVETEAFRKGEKRMLQALLPVLSGIRRIREMTRGRADGR